MKDYIIRGIDSSKTMRFFVGVTSQTVEKARLIHGSSATASAALGRVITATALMAMDMKNDGDSLTFSINGGGPGGNIVAVSNKNLQVKAYIDQPKADLENRPDGKLNVGGLVGRDGFLTVVKDLGLKEAYRGQTEIVTGEIAEDLASYFAISEQEASAVNLGVLVDKDLSIRAAGGYIVKLMPDVEEESIKRLEEALKNAEPVSNLVDQGLSPEEILEKVFGDLDVEVLEEREVDFQCDCSRERVEKLIISLGREEIERLSEDEETEVVCHFCNKKYKFSSEEVKSFLE